MSSLVKIMSLFLISIILILTSNVPSSFGHNDNQDNKKELRDLCSDTSNSNLCWDIIKSNYERFVQDDYRRVTAYAIDLAVRKANEIKDLLQQDHRDSNNDELKDNYKSCSENYHDSIHDLDQAKNLLDSNEYLKIPEHVEDSLKELKKCRNTFDHDSFDPSHIRDRNDEFLVYAEIVKISSNRLVKQDLN